MFFPWFFSFRVKRPKLPLGHIVSWSSNHATYDVYSPKVVETLIHGQCYGYCFLYCELVRFQLESNIRAPANDVERQKRGYK